MIHLTGTQKNGSGQMSKELEQSEKLFEVIKILMELGEKDLAFQLRLAHDTHLRVGWKETT